MFIEMKCAHCGKPFFPTMHYAYKEHYNGQVKYFCKYSCMLRHREQFKPPKPRPKKEIGYEY